MGAIMVNGTLTVCSPIASTTLWFNHPYPLCGTGTRKCTRVPCPTALSISRLPPIAAARSLMLLKPTCGSGSLPPGAFSPTPYDR
jgi:hypothetical protein